jgi:hypothetical protein
MPDFDAAAGFEGHLAGKLIRGGGVATDTHDLNRATRMSRVRLWLRRCRDAASAGWRQGYEHGFRGARAARREGGF